MDWKKFLSRKFLVSVSVVIIAVLSMTLREDVASGWANVVSRGVEMLAILGSGIFYVKGEADIDASRELSKMNQSGGEENE